ncbi:MAG: sulfotransferase [Lewinellaceae bacterium]|nr:sulfotransferase [Lewinellaceae bacterium]
MHYSGGSKALHALILGNPFLMKALLDMELSRYSGGGLAEGQGRPVFISGLARGGTTSLLQKLYLSGAFRSLAYEDMPFVLTPNLWRRAYPRQARPEPLEQRAHGDGILVNYQSPEAFDEVFWKVLCGKDYIRKDCLVPHSVSEEIVEMFRKYVAVVVRSGDKPEQNRYLSKNNNNILRIPALFQAFPDAVVLTPFREPVSHALSLLNQHERFVKINAQDPFSGRYMKWLGHFEFGLNHRPFQFDAGPAAGQQYQPADINYWLSAWVNYYQFALDNYADKLSWVAFESLCAAPRQTLGAIAELVKTRLDVDEAEPYKPPHRETAGLDKALLDRGEAIYDKLNGLAIR